MNIAAPQRIKEGSTRPVWSEDTWLQKHAGETLPVVKDKDKDVVMREDGTKETTESSSVSINVSFFQVTIPQLTDKASILRNKKKRTIFIANLSYCL